MVLHFSPEFSGKLDVGAQNSLSSCVIQGETLGNVPQVLGSSRLGIRRTPMDHESGPGVCLAMAGSEVGNESGGTDLARVVETDFNRQGTE